MAVDSSAWWPGGLTTANPFCKNKTGFQCSDMGGLPGSPCTTEHQVCTKRFKSLRGLQSFFSWPHCLFWEWTETIYMITFYQIMSQKEGSYRARGRTGIQELYLAGKYIYSSCYTSMIHFQEQLLILWKQHPTEEEEIHFGAGLG